MDYTRRVGDLKNSLSLYKGMLAGVFLDLTYSNRLDMAHIAPRILELLGNRAPQANSEMGLLALYHMGEEFLMRPNAEEELARHVIIAIAQWFNRRLGNGGQY